LAALALVAVAAVLCPRSGFAQRVSLRIRPHLGDTLRMKMEQRIEMNGDSSEADGNTQPMSAVMRVYTRAVVSKVMDHATELLSITDSVTVTPAIAASLPLFAQTKKSLEGKAVHLQVAQDGAISVMGVKDERFVQRLPAMLPGKDVGPGDEWTRELSVPVSATHASTGSAKVKFRLDSLGPDQTMAYISMHGTFSHAHPKDAADGLHDETSGTIDGMMIVDRRLEWMTDSQTTVTLLSTVSQPLGKPTHVHMKVMQSLRAMPRR
jgi:hypothetical protein